MEAALQLHYPPKFIHELKKGERITVDSAYAKIGKENGATSAYGSEAKSERAEKEHAGHEMGEHWIPLGAVLRRSGVAKSYGGDRCRLTVR